MASWSFDNAHLEPWDFGHPGWLNERASGHVISPYKEPLVFEVLAWTPDTNGALTGKIYQMITPDSPTEDEFKVFLESEKEKIKGKMVMVGKHKIIARWRSRVSRRKSTMRSVPCNTSVRTSSTGTTSTRPARTTSG